jgi:hypothetical protein
MKHYPFILLLILASACHKEKETHEIVEIPKPEVKDNGATIIISDVKQLDQFHTVKLATESVEAKFTAPAHVMATVVKSSENPTQNLILFDDKELSYNYASYLQHKVLINQWKINIGRVKDLLAHGAATGKDLIEAETQLANEEAAIMEHETKLKLGGFEPEKLMTAKTKTVWILSNVPENEVDKIEEGDNCVVHFSSFPNEAQSAHIEAVGDLVDNITRMIKVRILLANTDGRIKAGMFASVDFGLAEGSYVTVPRTALVTVAGKDYVFLKTGERQFERKEIMLGQPSDDEFIVLNGLKNGDEVAVTGTIQLKGLSFGY